MPNIDLVERIDRSPEATFDGQAFRHQPPHYDPLSGTGARRVGGRWNPAQSFSTLYLGTERRTATAEFERLLRQQGVSLADVLPRCLFRYEVKLRNVLDLRDSATLALVGLTEDDIAAEPRSKCQQVGEAAHHCGREGIIAPSATGFGSVLAVYIDRLMPGSELHPYQEELWLPDGGQ